MLGIEAWVAFLREICGTRGSVIRMSACRLFKNEVGVQFVVNHNRAEFKADLEMVLSPLAASRVGAQCNRSRRIREDCQ
jgi:hypothetical protein